MSAPPTLLARRLLIAMLICAVPASVSADEVGSDEAVVGDSQTSGEPAAEDGGSPPGDGAGARPAVDGATVTPPAPRKAPRKRPAPKPTPGAAKTVVPQPDRAGPPALRNVPSDKALSDGARAFQAHVRSARETQAAGDHRRAERHYRAALALDPDNAGLLAELAETLAAADKLRAATLAIRQSLALTFIPAEIAERLVTLGQLAEAQRMIGIAYDAYRNSQAIKPDPELEMRIENLGIVEPDEFASAITMCPEILDEWDCTPSTRPESGKHPCTCTLEKYIETPEAKAGGLYTTDVTGLTVRRPGVIYAAALLRVHSVGSEELDVGYLVVETGTGGWQMIGRMVEGWSPGAVFIGRKGHIKEFGFYDYGQPDEHGRTLVVRVSNGVTDGDFDANRTDRTRTELMTVCHSVPKPICVSFYVAQSRISEVMRADAPPPPTEELQRFDWRVEPKFDGAAMVNRVAYGSLPDWARALPGRHAFEDLAQNPSGAAISLR